jgi:hypothetical protein
MTWLHSENRKSTRGNNNNNNNNNVIVFEQQCEIVVTCIFDKRQNILWFFHLCKIQQSWTGRNVEMTLI